MCPHMADTIAPAVRPESNEMRRVLLTMSDIVRFAGDQCHSSRSIERIRSRIRTVDAACSRLALRPANTTRPIPTFLAGCG
jgi:hypothetical protein